MSRKLTLQYTAGWKYQVVSDLTWKILTPMKFVKPTHNRYYRLWNDGVDWYITIYCGCCWDGPTWFPDFEWMMFASLIHDVLHWLIAQGCIDETDNDAIDAELACIIRVQKCRFVGLRSWYVERATNRVNQRAGEEKKVHELVLEIN